jgi:uncharacterized repeat protein (TIGR03806 family)
MRYTASAMDVRRVIVFSVALVFALSNTFALTVWSNGIPPKLLSQTGAFTDLRTLTPATNLVPYDLNMPFWSDGALKQRWIGPVVGQRIGFSPTGEWKFPTRTMFVKHFELHVGPANTRRRLETRFLIVNTSGAVSGVTYKWRTDGTDAELLATNVTEAITVRDASGVRTQLWYFPSPADCVTCHTPIAGGILGVNTRQLNRELRDRGGRENQLIRWSRLGLLDVTVSEEACNALPHLPAISNTRLPVESRARSWLDANCSHCHRPEGTVANFDARYDTPPAGQNMVGAPVLIDHGIDGARVIAPGDIWRSILFLRVNTTEAFKMPPLAHDVVDREGVETLREWIQSLPGPPVVAPPTISPRGGEYRKKIRVSFEHTDPLVEIRYTLDGSVPGKTSAIYAQPIELIEPATVRAKAFKPGHTRSITVQETFLVGE